MSVLLADARQQVSTSRVHRHYLNSQCHVNTRRGSRLRRTRCEPPRSHPTPSPQPPKREKERDRKKCVHQEGTAADPVETVLIFLSDATWWINLSAISICYYIIIIINTALRVRSHTEQMTLKIRPFLRLQNLLKFLIPRSFRRISRPWSPISRYPGPAGELRGPQTPH